MSHVGHKPTCSCAWCRLARAEAAFGDRVVETLAAPPTPVTHERAWFSQLYRLGILTDEEFDEACARLEPAPLPPAPEPPACPCCGLPPNHNDKHGRCQRCAWRASLGQRFVMPAALPWRPE